MRALTDRLFRAFMWRFSRFFGTFLCWRHLDGVTPNLLAYMKNRVGNGGFNLMVTAWEFDGANVEMRSQVGEDNIVIFGLTAEEVLRWRGDGYVPREVIDASPELSQALSAIASGVFSPDDRDRYKELIAGIYERDWFMVAADFDSYAAAQRRVDDLWRDQDRWTAMAIRNSAHMGWFSSDRAIRQYARDIWHVPTA